MGVHILYTVDETDRFFSEDLREAEKLYRDFLRGYSLLTLVERRNCM